MSMLSSFLHPERGYQNAQKELDKYYNQAQGYQQPYLNQGQEAYGGLSGAMNSLLNPEELYSKWATGYETSPAALQAQQMAQTQGLDAASSLGLMGSSPALAAIQGGTSKIGLEDRQNYMNDLMQKYLAGAGLAQGVYNTGANAAGQMGQNAMNMGQNSANMQFGATNAPGNLIGSGLSTAAGLAGGALAGPIGYGLGSKMFGQQNMPQTSGFNPYGGG